MREARRRAPIRSLELPAHWTPAAVVAALPQPARMPAWLPSALEHVARGELDVTSTADALAALLSALAPFALFVEDLHEASEDALALWEALARRVGRSGGVGLLLTSRRPLPDVFQPRPVPPLTEEDTVALLEGELGTRMPLAAATWVHARTHGHPLFSLEYVRFLVQQGHLYSDGRRWHWRAPGTARLPSSVEALIAHQLGAARLSDAARRVWETLVLCPPEVCAEAGPTLADIPPAQWDWALRELRHAGLVREDGPAHPLYREVAAGFLGLAERRRWAARATDALEAWAPVLAAQFVPDAGLPPERAVTLLRRGACAAVQAGQRRAAATFLTSAQALGSGLERVALALDAARLWSALDPREAAALAQDILRSEPEHLEATFLLADALVAQGDEERAERLVDALGEGGREWFLSRLALHAEQHQSPAVLALWQACPQWHDTAPPHVVAAVGRALDFTGRSHEALELLGAALPDPGSTDAAVLLMARCRAHYGAGQLLSAEADATAVIELATPDDSPILLARALSSRATIRDTLGHYALALADAERSLNLFAALGVARDHAQQQTRLACLLLEYGEYARAEALLHEGREVLRRAEPTHFLALSEMNLAYLYLEQNPPHAGALALQYAHAGVHSARMAGSPLIVAQALGTAARAEAIHGSAARALALAHEALGLTAPDTHDAAWSAFALGFALEASGDVSGALDTFRAAVRHLEERGLTVWAARFALEADRLRGDSAAACERLAMFQAHDLRNWVNLTRRYFPELDAPAALPQPAAGLTLRVLGPWQVWRGEQHLPFRTPLGRALLTQLLGARLEGRPGVRPLELQQALYPHLPDEQAAPALHQLIYRTRQTLGSDAVVLTDAGYALGDVQTDAELFLQSGDVALWRGPLLDSEGLGTAADRLHLRLRASALERASAGDSAELARIGPLLVREDPFDLAVLELTLTALAASGQGRAAHALQRDVRARFAEVGEPVPAALDAIPSVPRKS
ncbi:hypothetical protein E7T09_17665 [Deinococcus sp. KSM4-11]|nr:hypothetical protein E7T09_17665 [Deinococcus sp. KSM4-11]